MKPIILVALLALTGCKTTVSNVDTSKIVVVKPPETLYNCPKLASLPNPETATNQDIARVILSLSRNNNICKVNIEQIKKFINDASKKFDAQGTK